ncbi:unnamed protein product [Durusdinium trenchii]|uniref:Uncharacterized protein n=2 Tax=Durusdinium trenchii TaxID=1381693 RepID=A0ABP0PX63_9DINO
MAAFSHYLTRSANFSALKSLPLVNPVTAWETVNDTHRRFSKTPGSAFCLVWTIVNVVFCLIPLALMAVLVKVSQLHFVTNGTPWTLQDYWTFVFFINAMAGLRGDIETERLKLLFDGQQEHYNFKAKVAERLVYHCDYGFWTGFVLFVTMSSAEFAQMRGEEDFKEVSLKKAGLLKQLEQTQIFSAPFGFAWPSSVRGDDELRVSDDGTLREWSSSGELLRSFNTAEGAQCLMRLWSRSSGEIFKDVKVATRYVKSLLLCGEYVFTGDYGNLVQQWHLATGELKAQFRGHKAGVICLALQGDHLVAGGGDGRVLLFDRSKATPNEEGLAVSEAARPRSEAQGFVCSLEICEDRLLVPDRDEDKVASIRLFSNTGELVPDNIRDVRTYKCSKPVVQATTAGKDIVLALCRDFTVKKFAAGSRQLLMSIKDAKTPYVFKVEGDRLYVGYLNHGNLVRLLPSHFKMENGKPPKASLDTEVDEKKVSMRLAGAGPVQRFLSRDQGKHVFPLSCACRSGRFMMDPALLERAAELGNAEAQYALGAALLTGHGRPKDLSRAVELCRLAAKQNHAAAQCNLGVLYAQGLGVEQDYERARSFYEASANQGDPNGCFNLALLYAEGVACDKDFAKAASLARSARDLGHPEAAAFLETLPGQDEYVLAQLRDLRARSRKLLEELQMDQPVRSKDLSAWAKQLEDMDDAENLVPRKAHMASAHLDAEIVD